MRDHAPRAAQPVAYALQRLHKAPPGRLHALFQCVNLFIQLRHERSDAGDYILGLHLVKQREGGVLHTPGAALGFEWLANKLLRQADCECVESQGPFNNKPSTSYS